VKAPKLIFEVTSAGSNLTYQWQKDGINISDGSSVFGATTSVLLLYDVTISDQGVYRCLVPGDCQNELSNPANLTVDQNPGAAGTITGTSTVCQGDANILYVVPAIAHATSYVWDLPYGASIISGTGTRSIQVKYANNAVSGTITVSGQNSCSTGTPSSAATITVNALPVAQAGTDQLVCGTDATLSANSVNGGWSILSGDGIISSPTVFNSDVTNLQQGENQFLWTVTSNGCTAVDTVSVTNTTLEVNAGSDQTVCSRNAELHAFAPSSGASWSIVSGSGLISQVNSTITEVTGLSQGSNEFSWSIINQGCQSSDNVIITNNMPLPPRAGTDQLIDADQTTLDADEPENGTVGTWSIASGSGTFTISTIRIPQSVG
jgi:hypothetical protein